jgi:hypothetical protein
MPGKSVSRPNADLKHASDASADTCLIIPVITDLQPIDTAVSHLIQTWVVPRLVQEYLRQLGCSPKCRFIGKSQY